MSSKRNNVKASVQNLHIVALPAHWADYLAHGNAALENFGDTSIDDVHATLAAHGVVNMACIDVSNEFVIVDADGNAIELAEYVFAPAKR